MNYLSIIFSGLLIVFLACSGSQGGDKSTASTNAKKGPDGEKIFKTYCITCHGIDGKLQLNGAKDLSISELPLGEKIEQITMGKNLMTPFEGILSDDQIKAVAEYTMVFKR